jgi:hypothetical protein
MTKKKYQKATMKVVNVECEQHLLSASGPVGPTMMSGTSSNWSELQ